MAVGGGGVASVGGGHILSTLEQEGVLATGYSENQWFSNFIVPEMRITWEGVKNTDSGPPPSEVLILQQGPGICILVSSLGAFMEGVLRLPLEKNPAVP